jgi:short-subunit dehydrogenase involved in D-alanine esterification of teichoic acids
MADRDDLPGRTALITGGTRGIGKGRARYINGAEYVIDGGSVRGV